MQNRYTSEEVLEDLGLTRAEYEGVRSRLTAIGIHRLSKFARERFAMVSFSFGGTPRYNKEIEHRNIPIRSHHLVENTDIDPGWQTVKYAYLAKGGWYIGGGGIVPGRAWLPSRREADPPSAPAASKAVNEPGGPDSITGSSGP